MKKEKVKPISSDKIENELKNDVELQINNIISDVDEKRIIIQKNIKNLYSGWRKFAFKDDIVNIAIGMIIATSFKNLIKSLVVDIIVPCLIGFGVGTNTENLFIILRNGHNNKTYITLKQAKDDGAVTLNYGLFIHVFIDLLFVSIILYLLMRFINKVKKEMQEELKKIELLQLH
jgi:large conductance mechanosensitive channel